MSHRLILTALPVIALFGVAGLVMAETTVSFSQEIKPDHQAVSLVNELDETVTEPSIPIEVETSNFPQLILEQLSTEQQTLRIINPLANTPWSVSIAATDGPAAVWSDGAERYDYNDAADGTDGADPDAIGGSLSLNPLASEIVSTQGSQRCSNDDLSLGSLARFQEGEQALSSITLVNGLATTASYCQWDVIGIDMQQVVPGSQATGRYRLNFTITIL